MTSLSDMLRSPVWWGSVVVAGLLVSLVAAYLKSLIDRSTSKALSRWRFAVAADKRKRQEQIALLRDEPDFRIVHAVALMLYSVVYTLLLAIALAAGGILIALLLHDRTLTGSLLYLAAFPLLSILLAALRFRLMASDLLGIVRQALNSQPSTKPADDPKSEVQSPGRS